MDPVHYAFRTFPTNDNLFLDFKNDCLQHPDYTSWNWIIFVQKLSNYLFNQDSTISITNCSTWAVCQDFLGLLNHHDLAYARSRGGIWSVDSGFTGKVITVRQVITELKKKFP